MGAFDGLNDVFGTEPSEIQKIESDTLFDNGLYCRADDRGDPVIQLSPPLICDQSHFDEVEQILRKVLTDAWSIL